MIGTEENAAEVSGGAASGEADGPALSEASGAEPAPAAAKDAAEAGVVVEEANDEEPVVPENDAVQAAEPAPPLPATQLEVTLLEGNGLEFDTPPAVIAFANTEHSDPPSGISVVDTCEGACWRYFQWVALGIQGQSLEASTVEPITALGVQLWGDTNDGWTRVLVDGQEMWTGDTFGSDGNWPGGAFVRYLQITGLPDEPHTLRVEHMGERDVTVFFFGFGLAVP